LSLSETFKENTQVIEEFRLCSPDEIKYDPRFAGPKGAESDVHIYFVGEALGREEAEQGLPSRQDVG
jgi:hypothetical protein